MFDWLKTETERKRDDYHFLYNSLKEALRDHDHKVSSASSAFHRYNHVTGVLSPTQMPSNDFERKREEINQRLITHFNKDKAKRQAIVAAKNKAYERYLHYKHMAVKEAEAEKEKREKLLKELGLG